MISTPVLLADLEDWMRILIIVVPIILYALNSLFSGEKKPEPRRQAPRDVPQRRPQADPARQQLDQEVEQFLRRAAEKRGEVPPAAQQAPPTMRSEPVAATLVSAEEQAATRWEEDFQQRAARLSQLAADEERRLKSHLQEAFDHKVGQLEAHEIGTLARRSAEKKRTPSAPLVESDATAVLKMLREPQTARRAIILAEILRRPENRW